MCVQMVFIHTKAWVAQYVLLLSPAGMKMRRNWIRMAIFSVMMVMK